MHFWLDSFENWRSFIQYFKTKSDEFKIVIAKISWQFKIKICQTINSFSFSETENETYLKHLYIGVYAFCKMRCLKMQFSKLIHQRAVTNIQLLKKILRNYRSRSITNLWRKVTFAWHRKIISSFTNYSQKYGIL